MSNIGGKLKEQTQLPEFTKKVGLFEAKVIAVNPTAEEYKDLLDIELKEDSKAVEYLGENLEGKTKLRLDFWLKEIKSGDKFKLTFFLENKDGSASYYLLTNRFKKHPAKSPDGMFDDIKIPNNLQLVLDKVNDYYQ